MRICWAIWGFSSILTLTIRTAPPVARTVFSRIGPSCLHGPHQGAQKSTITGASKDPSTTSVMNVAVVTSFTAAGPAPAPPINASLGLALLAWVQPTTWRHNSAMTSAPAARPAAWADPVASPCRQGETASQAPKSPLATPKTCLISVSWYDLAEPAGSGIFAPKTRLAGIWQRNSAPGLL